MPNWILDENVFQLSLEAPCGKVPEHHGAAKVLDFVQKHGRWVFSPAIHAAYLAKWRSSTCRFPLSVRRFDSCRASPWDSERHVYYVRVQPVDGRYHDDDEPIVSAAAKSGAGSILVTQDGRLRRRLVELGIPAEFGFTVVDVAGAIAIQATLIAEGGS